MAKVWLTGGERSLGKSICRYLESIDHEVQSLSRPTWDLTLSLVELQTGLNNKINREGLPEVFIHNSGITQFSWFEDADLTTMASVVNINLMARMAMNQTLIQQAISTRLSRCVSSTLRRWVG